MSRIIVVSNRLPVNIKKHSGQLNYTRSTGGLATGLASLSDSHESIWIGWPGLTDGNLTPENKAEITEKLKAMDSVPVFLGKKQVEYYYEGFSNKTIWPLFHYFPLRTIYEPRFWQEYKRVNEIFCEEVSKITRPDDVIWVHDYQLMLLPQLLREKQPELQIGFFLHIPFPSFELFRLLPWREELLKGLLGADLIGFHTYDYVRHFSSSICRILGLEHSLGRVNFSNRIVKIDAFPMGIDYEKYSGAAQTSEVDDEIGKIRKQVGNRKIVLSIDRLDYTKGIIQRLEAFDWFLSQNPEYKGKVTLILVAVPSRTDVEDYQHLRESLEHLVSRVNGEHGSLEWMPVWYLYRAVPFNRLIALYKTADVGLVTPLRDGMNLIAKEFVATKTDGKGVLILSEMAGAASELGEALLVNANSKMAIVAALKESLAMAEAEQIERNRSMQSRLNHYTITRWVNDFIHSLSEVKKTQQELLVRKLISTTKKVILEDFDQAKRRLFLLDYDGTLVGYQKTPDKAGPDAEILNILERLTSEVKNEVVIISGRNRNTLDDWLGSLNATLIAEHGAWFKPKEDDWHCIGPLKEEWKETIRPILQLYADRTPGALVEEKDFSLVWHCRRSEPELAYIRTQELRDTLVNLTVNLDVGVFEGAKILEIRHLGINKGEAIKYWLAKQKWDFILTAGDDYTDEEMFAVLPDYAYSIKVGTGASKARFNVDSAEDIRELLKELTGG